VQWLRDWPKAEGRKTGIAPFIKFTAEGNGCSPEILIFILFLKRRKHISGTFYFN